MYYLTYYEEYPIYEPAEGGYYYSGCNAVEWAYDENMDDVINYIPKFAEKFDLEIVKFHEGVAEYFRECFDEDFGSTIVAIEESKYIGDERYICIENDADFKSRECGWHPYE